MTARSLDELFGLRGRVALVTGGNGGIGLGMAEGLAAAGADLVIWGMNTGKNQAAADRLASFGRRLLVEQVDVSDEAAVIEGMRRAVEAMGRLDFVAANAGIGRSAASFEAMETALWREVMAVNLEGVFWTLREACRHMKARAEAGNPGGSVVAMSSVSAIHGAPRNQAYAATKGAVIAMIRGIAVEYGRYGIRANAILPGWTRSDMTAPLQAWDTFNEKAIGRVPMRRWGEPEDFAGVAVYLASAASRFHSGDTFVIDGAYSIF